MLNFIKSSFPIIIEILLWILLIGFIVGGFILGGCSLNPFSGFSCKETGAGSVIGAFIGFIAFVVIVIPIYGYIATIINIDKNVEILKNNNALQGDSRNETCSDANTNPNNENKVVFVQGSFTDSRDGKTYKTVKIGSQTWFAENLNFKCEESKCYGNNLKNADKYGRLYDWETAKKAVPAGWHLPTNEEWETLFRFVDGISGTPSPYNSKTAGKYLKAANGWNSNGNGLDNYGFAAMPGGYGTLNSNFDEIGYNGLWWSASESGTSNAHRPRMGYHYEDISWLSSDKSNLFSVRCIKD